MLSRTFAVRGGYHDITRYPEARRIPGLVLFRWDAPLVFANAEIFREHVLQAVADAPTLTAWIVAAAAPVTDVDITAAEMLSALDDDLAKARASRLPLLGDASGCMVGLGGGAMIPAPKCDLRAGRHYRL